MLLDEFFDVRRHFQRVIGSDFGSRVWLRMFKDFSENSGSIQLKTVMQRLAVLPYVDLMQRAALTGYCSAPLKLVSVVATN